MAAAWAAAVGTLPPVVRSHRAICAHNEAPAVQEMHGCDSRAVPRGGVGAWRAQTCRYGCPAHIFTFTTLSRPPHVLRTPTPDTRNQPMAPFKAMLLVLAVGALVATCSASPGATRQFPGRCRSVCGQTRLGHRQPTRKAIGRPLPAASLCARCPALWAGSDGVGASARHTRLRRW